jgi:hypothetical protein
VGVAVHPSQFQLKVAPGAAVPLQVIVVEAEAVEGEAQIIALETAKGPLLGVAFTVTKTVVIGDKQPLGLRTCKVIVFVPVVDQLTVWGPWPEGFPPIQLLQFQV